MAWSDFTTPPKGWNVTQCDAGLGLTTTSVLTFVDATKDLATNPTPDWGSDCTYVKGMGIAGNPDIVQVLHGGIWHTIKRIGNKLQCFEGIGNSDPIWEAQEG